MGAYGRMPAQVAMEVPRVRTVNVASQGSASLSSKRRKIRVPRAMPKRKGPGWVTGPKA